MVFDLLFSSYSTLYFQKTNITVRPEKVGRYHTGHFFLVLLEVAIFLSGFADHPKVCFQKILPNTTSSTAYDDFEVEPKFSLVLLSSHKSNNFCGDYSCEIYEVFSLISPNQRLREKSMCFSYTQESSDKWFYGYKAELITVVGLGMFLTNSDLGIFRCDSPNLNKTARVSF